MPETLKPRLIIGIGNPSRGDDALGALCIEQLQNLDLPDTDLLTDFQLQIEYVLDLQGRRQVIFVDATVSGEEAYSFTPAAPQEDNSTTSHALSPSALLHAYGKFGTAPLPDTHILAIRGYSFELGHALSPQAADNLQQALQFLHQHIGNPARA
jgi:hydrogenase maturation protease